MEKFFYWYGYYVSKYNYLFILLCFLITALSTIGLLKLRMENNGIKLWIPKDSSQRINTDWLWDNYPPELRFASMIFKAPNVLEPDVIRAMYRIHKEIETVRTENDIGWNDLCMTAPIVKPPPISSLLGKKRKKRQGTANDDSFFDFDNFMDDDDDFFSETEDENEAFLNVENELQTAAEVDAGEYFNTAFYPDPYCNTIGEMKEACLEMSILELWAHDGKFDQETDEEIANLTLDGVLEKINQENAVSGVFLIAKNFTELLSKIRYDSNGRIGKVSHQPQFFTNSAARWPNSFICSD